MTILEKIKDIFSLSRLKEKRVISLIIGGYEELPPEQKKMVNLGLLGGGVILIVFLFSLGYGKVSTLRENITSQQKILTELLGYRESFERQRERLNLLEKEVKMKSADFSLLASLETLAQSAAIGRESIESISPKQLPAGKFFMETEATVQLVRVTLRQLVDYFYKIENLKTHMTIKEVRIKPRFDNPQFLNVTFKVSAYLPKE